MGVVEFQAWPKIPRLRRPIIVTEKIDGTNAAILIVPWAELVAETSEGYNWSEDYYRQWGRQKEFLLGISGAPIQKEFEGSTWAEYDEDAYAVFAQSRTRLLSVEKDNFGFARWVAANVDPIVEALGPGRHFGEWWGGGIQRGYGVKGGAKRFSLFNVDRYAEVNTVIDGVPVRPVPTLGRSNTFSSFLIDNIVTDLAFNGSVAEPGYDRPEGVVVYHTAGRHTYKRLIEGDDVPKGENG